MLAAPTARFSMPCVIIIRQGRIEKGVSSSVITAHHSHVRWHVKPPLRETNLFLKCSKITSTDDTLTRSLLQRYSEPSLHSLSLNRPLTGGGGSIIIAK
jgi:hypothetical protein